MDSSTTADKVDTLLQGELLNRDQAEAYVRRVIERESRASVAETMSLSEDAVQNHAMTANRQLLAAQETVLALEDIGGVPEACDNCGDRLGASMALHPEGPVYCDDCASGDGR